MDSNDPSEALTQGRSDILGRLSQASRVQREAGMPMEKLTDAEAAKLRNKIGEWLRTYGIVQANLAARLEVSKTTLSQVLSGTYRADPSRFLRALDELTRLPVDQLRDLTAPETITAVRISTVEDMEGIVNGARDINTCALIWGPSGSGKTTYAKGRALEKLTCLYVNLTGKGYTPSRLLRHIAKDLRLIGGLLEYKNSPDLLHERICNHLAGNRRVVFIDNAHLLDKHGLWCLHSIHDACGAIIVCLGQPALWDTVNKSRSDKGIGATVYARFGLKLNLEASTAARPDPTDGSRMFRPKRQWLHTPEDVKRYLDSRKVKVHPAVLDWLHKLVNCPDYGGFHELEDIVSVFERYYTEAPVLTMEILAQVDSVIRPPEEQQRMRESVESLRPAVAG